MPFTKEERAAYMRDYMPDYRHQRRARAVEALGGKCVRCGSHDALEFDHIDRSTKVLAMGHLWQAGDDVIAAEMAKCQLLCHDCHRRKSIECGDLPEATHGSIGMYKHHACRCDLCRAAYNKYAREYKRRRKADKTLAA